MKFVNLILISGIIMTSVVSTDPRMEKIYKKYDIEKWDSLPSITFDDTVKFFTDFWELYNKFSGREYNKPLERPQRGPLKYIEHKKVTNIWEDRFSAWIYFFNTWDAEAFWNIFAIEASYLIIPYVGGYFRAQTYVEYARDPYVYHGAGISLDYLHMEAMELFKMSFWAFFNLLDENN